MTGYRRIVIVGCAMLCYSILGFLQNAHAQSQKELAKEIAQEWFAEQNSTLKAHQQSASDVDISEITNQSGELFLAEYSTTGFLLFYIIDNVPDILGYSLSNDFPKDQNHPIITEWIPKAQPTKQQGFDPDKQPDYLSLNGARGHALKTMQDIAIEPLIEASWGQGIPWNKFCPADNDGRKAPVGCVAVAMAQVMKKWNWPERGYGSNSYTPSNYPAYGEQYADFDTLYQWSDMHAKQATEASAFLLYHAGVASYMNYGPNESGANTSTNAPIALKNNFKYYQGIQVREKERYSEKDWFKMLRQELINERPLIYFGANPDGGTGHAFNIDGFHSESYFHFNWGWNGAGNGYFRLENMADGGGNFTKGQAAIFWIQPENIPMHDRPGAVQTLPGDGFIQLLWDDLTSNNFSHYKVYRNGSFIGTSINNAFKDQGLTNGLYYTYQISAAYVGDEEGESVLTEEISAKPIANLELDYTNGFETSPDNWEFKDTDRGFRWGLAADLGIPGNDGHVMAIRSDQSAVGEQVMDYMTAPGLDIRGINHVAISFDYMFKQNPGVDYLFLMYRRYDNGLWYPIGQLETTGDWSDWNTVYYYFPEEAKYFPIQLGFYYNDFRGQGYGAAIDNIKIWTIDEPPIPEFSIVEDTICQYELMVYNNESTGNIYSWYWDFGDGATPRFSETKGPHYVRYNTPGTKSASLLLNHLDLNHKNNLLQVIDQPTAGFTVEIDGLHAIFTDTSSHGEYYWWDFGDGRTSTEKSPQNKYREFEIFTVTQVIYNDYCLPDTMKLELDFRMNSGIDDHDTESLVNIYPNPSNGLLNIEIENFVAQKIDLCLYTINGKNVYHASIANQQKVSLDIRHLNPGIYFLILSSDGEIHRKKLVIE